LGAHHDKNLYPDHSLSERTILGMVAELTEMVTAVRQGRQPEPGGEAGRTSIALVHAVYQATARGAWVEIA
jgi:predicted dehydrogenase